MPGNTIPSFEAAVEAGVDIIEFDVLRPRGDFAAGGRLEARAEAGPAEGSGPLVVAHDWGAAARGEPADARTRRSTPSPGRRSTASGSTST